MMPARRAGEAAETPRNEAKGETKGEVVALASHRLQLDGREVRQGGVAPAAAGSGAAERPPRPAFGLLNLRNNPGYTPRSPVVFMMPARRAGEAAETPRNAPDALTRLLLDLAAG
jgi:hypothetical protein